MDDEAPRSGTVGTDLGHHMYGLYADDTQLMAHSTINDIPSVATRQQNCIEAIQVWCNSRRLQLNPKKTELIWFESKTNLKKIADLDLNLYIGPDIIKPVDVVCDLNWNLLEQQTIHGTPYQYRTSSVPVSSIFAALNPSVESSVPMSRRVWYRLL